MHCRVALIGIYFELAVHRLSFRTEQSIEPVAMRTTLLILVVLAVMAFAMTAAYPQFGAIRGAIDFSDAASQRGSRTASSFLGGVV